MLKYWVRSDRRWMGAAGGSLVNSWWVGTGSRYGRWVDGTCSDSSSLLRTSFTSTITALSNEVSLIHFNPEYALKRSDNLFDLTI